MYILVLICKFANSATATLAISQWNLHHPISFLSLISAGFNVISHIPRHFTTFEKSLFLPFLKVRLTQVF